MLILKSINLQFLYKYRTYVLIGKTKYGVCIPGIKPCFFDIFLAMPAVGYAYAIYQRVIGIKLERRIFVNPLR
jgi:hypothetical protein